MQSFERIIDVMAECKRAVEYWDAGSKEWLRLSRIVIPYGRKPAFLTLEKSFPTEKAYSAKDPRQLILLSPPLFEYYCKWQQLHFNDSDMKLK